MRTLLTGATGLIGANLVRTLLRAGQRPRVLLTPGSDARSLGGLDLERVSGDVRDAHSLAKAMTGVQRVFHAAGHVRFDQAGRLLLMTINVEGTRQVLQAARSAGVRRLVHVSSSVTIGHGTLDRPATEEAAPLEPGTPYAESKRAAEELALGDWGDLQVVVCNPTFVVGAYGTGATSAEVVRPVASGVVKAYPPGGANFVNADDVAEGLVLVMRAGRPRTRYILGGENLTLEHLLGELAAITGLPRPRMKVPRLLSLAVAAVSETVEGRFLHRHPSVPLEAARMSTSQMAFDTTRARDELGYAPRPAAEALEASARWFVDRGMVNERRRQRITWAAAPG